jgi:nitroreductase
MSSEPVPFEPIENAIRCAAPAPSGANQQPWTFVVVKDPKIKRKIREAAEAEERESYEHRMPQAWLDALAPFRDRLVQGIPRDCAIPDCGLSYRFWAQSRR